MQAKKLFTALLTGLLAVALNAGIATVLVAASAQDASASTRNKSQKSYKAKKSKGGKVTFDRGSEETTADRAGRLKRECKGRANSGACSGFGQGS